MTQLSVKCNSFQVFFTIYCVDRYYGGGLPSNPSRS